MRAGTRISGLRRTLMLTGCLKRLAPLKLGGTLMVDRFIAHLDRDRADQHQKHIQRMTRVYAAWAAGAPRRHSAKQS